MPKIIQLSAHIANLIAAGEVVERPASVVKELLENAVDAGASQVTIEIQGGGMTFLRVTDNGCGMSPEDARTAFLRHATSKLRTAEDLAGIVTMGFRGEALAAIASVSRIELITKQAGSISGTSLTLEAGKILEQSEAGCPDGTTIIVRDIFFNTPARMKFMKSDTVEAGRISSAVQMQALAHPKVAFRYIRDGKQVLSTPGSGKLEDAVYCVYGKDSARMVSLESHWENYSLNGYVSKPTDARPTRGLQTFFVNGRPVRSKLLTAALEEAYRNQLMVGKFPACVLYLTLPPNAVDVNVHPAKTEVKFLNEKSVFDCVHYGVLGALNKTPDRPQVHFAEKPVTAAPAAAEVPAKPAAPAVSEVKAPAGKKQDTFFRTMTAQEYRNLSQTLQSAPQPEPAAAKATLSAVNRERTPSLHDTVLYPSAEPVKMQEIPSKPPVQEEVVPEKPVETVVEETAPEQQELTMPKETPWRFVGELYNTYILVEQGEDAFLIDKHAAHERILFDKLKQHQEAISSQSLLTPIPCRLSPEYASILLENGSLLEELGFEAEGFGENTVLLRQIPMDLAPEDATDALDAIAADLLSGRKERRETVRDNILHTVACKAAIKAGWHTDPRELEVIAATVMEREDLKYCPHGRPICVSLSKKQLEKQFKRV